MNYKRILLKLSGEILSGDQKFGIHGSACQEIASAIKKMQQEGFEIAIVIGGGNIFRGVNLKELGMHRTPADQIGMLATLMNGISLQQALEGMGCKARVMSALDCPKVAESYNWHLAMEYLSKGEILIFVGGTGNPYFTTDTAAALRANEIHADILMKATKVDGIYNKDPLKNRDAVKYDTLTYSKLLSEKLEVMDATAAALCMSNKLPIFVFNMSLLNQQPLTRILAEKKGTLVEGI